MAEFAIRFGDKDTIGTGKTHRKIYFAMERLFLGNQWNFTLGELAHEAGVSQPCINYNFRPTQKLFGQMAEGQIELLEQYRSWYSQEMSPMRTLSNLLDDLHGDCGKIIACVIQRCGAGKLHSYNDSFITPIDRVIELLELQLRDVVQTGGYGNLSATHDLAELFAKSILMDQIMNVSSKDRSAHTMRQLLCMLVDDQRLSDLVG